MSAPMLSSLREPPVAGRFYMVPVVDAVDYCGITGQLPVIGPAHTDADHFRFPHRHYHVDSRFLTGAEREKIGRYYGSYTASPDVHYTVGALPLSNHYGAGLPPGIPRLARRRCYSAETAYRHAEKPQVIGLRKDYGDPAEPIRLADGRLLCPHRKADLSSFAPDAAGLVTCPLHGLRVRCCEQVSA